MAKIVNISDNIYPIEDVILDLVEIKDSVKDIAFVVILKDGTAQVSHTGLSLQDLALVCKLMDKEFSNMVEDNA